MQRTGSVQVERGSLSDYEIESSKLQVHSISEQLERPESSQSTHSQEHWMAESRERTHTVINTMEYEVLTNQGAKAALSFDETCSHHSSLFVEDDSDVDVADLISLQDVLDFSEDDKSYLSEAEADADADAGICLISTPGFLPLVCGIFSVVANFQGV